jgi:septal ring factor EnvC (AmiA/AmiB activator)
MMNKRFLGLTLLLCAFALPNYVVPAAATDDDELQRTRDELRRVQDELSEFKGKWTKLTEAARKQQIAFDNNVAAMRKELDTVNAVHAKCLSLLTESLTDRDAAVRRWCAQSLGKLGGSAHGSVPALLRAAKDRDKSVAEAAKAAVMEIDPISAQRAGFRKN